MGPKKKPIARLPSDDGLEGLAFGYACWPSFPVARQGRSRARLRSRPNRGILRGIRLTLSVQTVTVNLVSLGKSESEQTYIMSAIIQDRAEFVNPADVGKRAAGDPA